MTPLAHDPGMECGLHEVIDALAGADLGVLDDGGLHAAVVGLGRELDRLQIVLARHAREWASRGIHEQDGSKSAAARLARESHCGVDTAREVIGRGRGLDHLGSTVAAVMEGRLSVDHLDLFARTNTPARRALFARDEQVLIDQCAGLFFFQAVKALAYWANRADDELARNHPDTETPDDDPDGSSGDDATSDDPADQAGEPTDPAEPTGPTAGDAGSRVYASRTLDGTLALNGVLGAIDGEIVEHELQRLVGLLRAADAAAGVSRSPAALRAAALVEMATRSATAPADGRRPQPLFSVVIGSDTLDHLCELATGTVITPGQLVPWLSRAMLQTMLFSGPRTVLTVSSRRTFTGALRRAIEVRDRHCQHPTGCDTPAHRCHVDHIVPWEHGGTTSQFNGRLLCEPQNVIPRLRDRTPAPLPEQQVNDSIITLEQLRWRLQHEPPPPGMHLEWRWAPDHPAPDAHDPNPRSPIPLGPIPDAA